MPEKSAISNEFCYEKFIQFHETDIMGIAHHSNHLKWMEETRVAWLREKGLLSLHSPGADFTLAVLESYVSYRKPCLLGEKIQVYLKLYTDKLKYWFYYGIYSENTLRAYGHTMHIGVDKNLKVKKPPQGLIDPIKENTAWTETWPSNL
jgi:acyl-CoA thioester hydrolase